MRIAPALFVGNRRQFKRLHNGSNLVARMRVATDMIMRCRMSLLMWATCFMPTTTSGTIPMLATRRALTRRQAGISGLRQ